MKPIAKQKAKQIIIAACILAAIPFWVLYRLWAVILGSKEAFYMMSQAFSLYPGIPGNLFRYGFYKLSLKKLGPDSAICFGATLSNPDICIGSGSYIGPHCNLGLCEIGDKVLLGTGAQIVSGFHQHGIERVDIPMVDQPGEFKCIRIGNDCWIGNQSLVGADIGDHVVIGAGSLVTEAIPSYAIAMGRPAKVIRDRRDPDLKPLESDLPK